jgi:hypothetical protein
MALTVRQEMAVELSSQLPMALEVAIETVEYVIGALESFRNSSRGHALR